MGESNQERRKNDERFDKILKLITEIHQRQLERTIPAIEKLENTIFGNGKSGCLEQHIEMRKDINNLWEGFRGIKKIMVTSALLIFGAIVTEITRILLK